MAPNTPLILAHCLLGIFMVYGITRPYQRDIHLLFCQRMVTKEKKTDILYKPSPNEFDRAFMEEAVHLSIENVEKKLGGPFGCVIVGPDGVSVIGRGCNSVVRNHDPTAHAEIMAVRKACLTQGTWDLSGCRVYSSCEPCPMCFSALMWAKVSRIFYANTRKDAGKIGFQDDFLYDILGGRGDPLQTIMERMPFPQAITAFQLWESGAEKHDLY